MVRAAADFASVAAVAACWRRGSRLAFAVLVAAAGAVRCVAQPAHAAGRTPFARRTSHARRARAAAGSIFGSVETRAIAGTASIAIRWSAGPAVGSVVVVAAATVTSATEHQQNQDYRQRTHGNSGRGSNTECATSPDIRPTDCCSRTDWLEPGRSTSAHHHGGSKPVAWSAWGIVPIADSSQACRTTAARRVRSASRMVAVSPQGFLPSCAARVSRPTTSGAASPSSLPRHSARYLRGPAQLQRLGSLGARAARTVCHWHRSSAA